MSVCVCVSVNFYECISLVSTYACLAYFTGVDLRLWKFIKNGNHRWTLHKTLFLYPCEQFIANTEQHVISVLTFVWMLCRKTLYCTHMSVLWPR